MVKTRHIALILLCLLVVWRPAAAESAVAKHGKAAELQNHHTIPEGKLLDAYTQYLCRRLQKESIDVAVSKFKVAGNKPVPAGEIDVQLYQKNRARLQGYVRLIAVISVDGVVKNKVKLLGWVDVFESVVCASRNFKRGEILKEDDVYLARKNVSHLRSNYLTDISSATGLMVKHNIKADSCLKEWMLKKSPIVVKGDVVTIIAESSGLRITVPGRVLMKGFTGELVKVQNLMSKKEIYAKVVNAAIVKVDF